MEQISWLFAMQIDPANAQKVEQICQKAVDLAKKEDGTLIYEWSFSDDKKLLHVVERYQNSQAVLLHLDSFVKNIASDLMSCGEVSAFYVYGEPNSEAKERLGAMGAKFMKQIEGFAR